MTLAVESLPRHRFARGDESACVGRPKTPNLEDQLRELVDFRGPQLGGRLNPQNASQAIPPLIHLIRSANLELD